MSATPARPRETQQASAQMRYVRGFTVPKTVPAGRVLVHKRPPQRFRPRLPHGARWLSGMA